MASRLPARALLCSVLLTGTIGAATIAAGDLSIPDLTGDHVIVDTRSGTELHRTRVEVSSRGMRVSNLLDGRLAIMNFALERYWFVDRTRRLVHEVPIRTVSGTVGPVGDADASRIRLAAGVFSPEPCAGHEVGSSTSAVWRGRPVELVDCTGAGDEIVSLDYYSSDMGVVIRSVAANGVAEEFHDVRRVILDDARFLPPPDYPVVDLDRFSSRRSSLSSYGPGQGSRRIDRVRSPLR